MFQPNVSTAADDVKYVPSSDTSAARSKAGSSNAGPTGATNQPSAARCSAHAAPAWAITSAMPPACCSASTLGMITESMSR